MRMGCRIVLPMLLACVPGVAFAAEPSMLGIFTDRCRTVFAQGEEVEVSVVVRAAEALDGALLLSLDGPDLAVTLARKPVQLQAGARATFSWRVRPDITALLKPAGYTLKARLGALEARPFPLQIVSTTKETHLVIYEANWSGTRDYGGSIQGVPRMVACYADAFHNLAMDLNNVWGNVYPALKDPMGVADAEKALVPEEWLRDRDFMDFACEELLRNRMGRVVQLHGVWCRTLRLGLEQNMRDYMHTYCSAVQNWKRFPNFLGLSYGDDLNTLGDWESGSPESPQSDPDFQERMKFFIADFSKQHPELGVSRETLLPTNEKMWRAWADYLTERFPEASAQWHEALEQQMANFITTHTDGIFYVQNLAAGNYAPKMYRNMTVAQTKTEADIGTGPFQAELCAEVLSAGKRPEQPVWVSSWGRFMEGTTTIVQRAVSLLGRKMEGVGPFSLDGFDMLSKNGGPAADHFSLGRRERNKLAGELCTRYGDMCIGLKPDNNVAVLYSYSQAMFDVNLASWKSIFRTSEFNFNPHTAYLNQAMVANQAFIDIWRAGFLPKVIAEEDVLAGRLSNYEALVLVGLTHPLPEGVMDRIAEFQKAGGRVLVDDQTTIAIPGAIKLGVRFNRPGYQAWKQMIKSFRAPVAESQTPHELVYRYGQPNWPVIREKLSFIKPLAARTNPRVFVSQQSWGTGTYLFVTHDTPPKDWDPDKFWLPNSQWIVPIRTELRLQPGQGTIYDVFSMKEVPVKAEGGARVLPVDLRTIEGRIYAILPAPIARVNLKAPDSVTTGTRFAVEVQVVDAQGRPIDALVAVQIVLDGPKGEWVKVFRAAGGEEGCREEFTLGINDNPGVWTVRVNELFNGMAMTKKIQVAEAEPAPGRRAVFEVPDVAVFNVDAIRKLLAKGNEVNIAIDEGQEEYTGLAEMLRDSLKAKGITCSVLKMSDAIIPNPGDAWMRGRAERFYTSDLPDAKCHLIMLSGAKANPRLRSLHWHGFCSRSLTPNYPGQGRAMIDYHWSPFTGGFDVISLVSADDAGLAKAIEEFDQIVDGKVSREVEECQTLARNLEAVRTAILPPKVAWRPAPATFEVPKAKGKPNDNGTVFERHRYDLVAKRFGDTVMALAASPNGKFIAAGTNSFFKNVFLIGDDGKVLWANKVGPIYIDRVAVTDDGTVIAACIGDGSVQVFGPKGEALKKFEVRPVYTRGGGLELCDPFAFAGGTVILNQRDSLEAFKLDGTKVWEWEAPATIWTMAASSGGTVLTVGCWDEPVLVRLDPVTGQETARISGVTADTLTVTPDSSFTTVCGKGELKVLDANLRVIYQRKSPQVKAAGTDKAVIAATAEGRTGGMAFDTNIYITQIDTGSTWTWPMGDVIGDIVAGPRGIITYSWDGHVHRFSPYGRGKGSPPPSGPGGRVIVLPDGDIVVGTAVGNVIRVPGAGAAKWVTRVPPPGQEF